MLSGKPPEPVQSDDTKVIKDLGEVYAGVSQKNVLEAYHDSLQLKEEAATLFSLGYLDLRARGRVERLFWDCCEKILRITREMPYVPEELEPLEKGLADTYYGNFSVFQSVPDHWAVKQLFPVMPIHRLEEKPTRRGVFADLTCDSDGKIDKFIDPRDVKDVSCTPGTATLLHRRLPGRRLPGDPRRLHNLFGDTDAVHVRLAADGLRGRARRRRRRRERRPALRPVRPRLAHREGPPHHRERHARRQISLEDSARLRRRYEEGLNEYTYLTRNGGPDGNQK